MSNELKDKRKLYVILDENMAVLDARIKRLVICAVEISPESFAMAQDYFNCLRRRVCMGKNSKFHFTDINDNNTRLEIIDKIIKLGVECKTFIFYSGIIGGSNFKSLAIRRALCAIKKQLCKRYDVEYVVESAEEYKNVVKDKCLTNDKTLTIISDAFCFAVAQRLDYERKKAQIISLAQASLLKENFDMGLMNDNIYFAKLSVLNRLEVYDFSCCQGGRLARESKLAPLD